MHGVIRTYTGTGASALFNVLEAHKAEVETELKKVKGFRSYMLMRTADGGLSVTVCDDKSGTEDSATVARDWVTKNAGTTGASAPSVTEGTVIIHAA